MILKIFISLFFVCSLAHSLHAASFENSDSGLTAEQHSMLLQREQDLQRRTLNAKNKVKLHHMRLPIPEEALNPYLRNGFSRDNALLEIQESRIFHFDHEQITPTSLNELILYNYKNRKFFLLFRKFFGQAIQEFHYDENVRREKTGDNPLSEEDATQLLLVKHTGDSSFFDHIKVVFEESEEPELSKEAKERLRIPLIPSATDFAQKRKSKKTYTQHLKHSLSSAFLPHIAAGAAVVGATLLAKKHCTIL